MKKYGKNSSPASSLSWGYAVSPDKGASARWTKGKRVDSINQVSPLGKHSTSFYTSIKYTIRDIKEGEPGRDDIDIALVVVVVAVVVIVLLVNRSFTGKSPLREPRIREKQ